MKTRTRYRTFGGAGCFLQLVALIMFGLAIATIPTLIGPVIFGILGLAFAHVGAKKTQIIECRRCGNTVESKRVKICPHCSAGARVVVAAIMCVGLFGCDGDPVPQQPPERGHIVHVQIVEDGEGPERESQSRYVLLWDDYTVVELTDGTRRMLPGVWGEVGDSFVVRPNQYRESP